MEGDEDRLGKAAHMMVQNLAANLANVTCKDPLRISMLTNIRTILGGNGLSEASSLSWPSNRSALTRSQALDDTRLGHLVHDNLDAACAIVENVAKEKALLEIDEALSAQYIARRKHRDRSTQPFWDSTAMAATHYSSMLPDALRLKLGGLQPAQLRVYEDFSRARVGLPTTAEGEAAGMKGLMQRASNAVRPVSPGEDGRSQPNTMQFAIAQVTVRSLLVSPWGVMSYASLRAASANSKVSSHKLPPTSLHWLNYRHVTRSRAASRPSPKMPPTRSTRRRRFVPLRQRSSKCFTAPRRLLLARPTSSSLSVSA